MYAGSDTLSTVVNGTGSRMDMGMSLQRQNHFPHNERINKPLLTMTEKVMIMGTNLIIIIMINRKKKHRLIMIMLFNMRMSLAIVIIMKLMLTS